ncbi:hypothetical protein J4404_02440 [Candidatus Woesearchaeota archaeon]|nr:hypothetical protein [Candidatus Woesearchaeota archaeon]
MSDETLKKAHIILEQRIKACEKTGHKNPVKEKNRCHYCYQRLAYITPNLDELISLRKLLYHGKPVDEEYLRLLKNNEEHKKTEDYDIGLINICREIKNGAIMQADQ